jgi:hypothetical protein
MKLQGSTGAGESEIRKSPNENGSLSFGKVCARKAGGVARSVVRGDSSRESQNPHVRCGEHAAPTRATPTAQKAAQHKLERQDPTVV